MEYLFNGSVPIAVEREWRPWTPREPPIPKEHPFGRECQFRYYKTGGLTPMCLVKPREGQTEWVSYNIAAYGYWPDCHLLSNMWHREGASGDIFLDVGANIGACTVEILARTNARVIAFEPNPSNLYHLTRTLAMASARRPSLLDRVVVLPVAAGDVSEWTSIAADMNNMGNSVITNTSEELPKLLREDSYNRTLKLTDPLPVRVLTLDMIFPSGFGLNNSVRLMKLDTQGFETKVLRGARGLLRRRRDGAAPISAIAAEFERCDPRLRGWPHSCTEDAKSLTWRLQHSGYNVTSRATMTEAIAIAHIGYPLMCPKAQGCRQQLLCETAEQRREQLVSNRLTNRTGSYHGPLAVRCTTEHLCACTEA